MCSTYVHCNSPASALLWGNAWRERLALTHKQCQNAKAGRHSDGGGLYLLVKPSGARSWVLRVQRNGTRKDFGIGGVLFDPIPDLADTPLERRKALTLAEAREKARRGKDI